MTRSKHPHSFFSDTSENNPRAGPLTTADIGRYPTLDHFIRFVWSSNETDLNADVVVRGIYLDRIDDDVSFRLAKLS